MERVSNSPNLSPIQTLSHIIKKKLRLLPASTVMELRRRLQDIWYSLAPEDCQQLALALIKLTSKCRISLISCFFLFCKMYASFGLKDKMPEVDAQKDSHVPPTICNTRPSLPNGECSFEKVVFNLTIFRKYLKNKETRVKQFF